MPAVLLSPIRARTLARSRTNWGTATFSTPSATPPPTRHGLKSCGGSYSIRLTQRTPHLLS
jgi:hypothetical protein